jgi:transcriptional regulator with XRE-family HTH domain
MKETPDSEDGLRLAEQRAAIGRDLRALRQSKQLTLQQLADRIGRSVGYLSQVERGLSDLPIADLRAIAGVFGVPMGLFFTSGDTAPQQAPGEARYIVRASQRRRLGSRDSGITEELLSPDLGGSFETFLTVIEPGAERTQQLDRGAEEAAYLISGSLEIRIGERTFVLNEGDSFRIDCEAFGWRNPTERRAVLVWTLSPPVY